MTFINLDLNEIIYLYRATTLENNIYYWCGKTSLEVGIQAHRFNHENLGKKMSSSVHTVTEVLVFPNDDSLGDYFKITEEGTLIAWCDNWKELQNLSRQGKL